MEEAGRGGNAIRVFKGSYKLRIRVETANKNDTWADVLVNISEDLDAGRFAINVQDISFAIGVESTQQAGPSFESIVQVDYVLQTYDTSSIQALTAEEVGRLLREYFSRKSLDGPGIRPLGDGVILMALEVVKGGITE